MVLRGKGEDQAILEGKEDDHVVLECFFLPRSLGSRRDFAGKKRGERTLAGEPWEGAAWLWQSGDPVAATQLMVPGA